MHESSLKYLRCPRCGSDMDLVILEQVDEIDEGFLDCNTCSLCFPIVCKIPILWDDTTAYLSERQALAKRLIQKANSLSMVKFLKSCISRPKAYGDVSLFEERQSVIYQNSSKSRFYSIVQRELDLLPASGIALEYGSSIGVMADCLSETCDRVFGIDRSFGALLLANKSLKNIDYIVADFLSPIFKGMRFDLILALNVLELVEPKQLLGQFSRQISTGGMLVLSDPYDYDRGVNSVKHPLDPVSLRSYLRGLGFSISAKTENPSYLPWNLKINPRTLLGYRTDLVIAKFR